VAVAVKDAGKGASLGQFRGVVDFRRDDGLVEDLAAGQIRVQVDVGGQDEVLVVISGTLAEGDQVGGRGDLVCVVRFSRTPAVLGVSRQDKHTRGQG